MELLKYFDYYSNSLTNYSSITVSAIVLYFTYLMAFVSGILTMSATVGATNHRRYASAWPYIKIWDIIDTKAATPYIYLFDEIILEKGAAFSYFKQLKML